MTGSFIENALFGDSNAGPYHLTDTSLLLMTSSLRWGSFDGVKSFESLSSRIMAWLALRWTLREITLLTCVRNANPG